MAVGSSGERTHIPITSDEPSYSDFRDQAAGAGTNDAQPRTGFGFHVRSVSPCMRFAVLFLFVSAVIVAFASPNPLYSLFFGFLAVLPAGIVAKFIVSNFGDPAVSDAFLINQFILGAVPLTIAVIIVELLIGIVLAITIFSKEIPMVAQSLPGALSANGTIIQESQPSTENTTRAIEAAISFVVRQDVGDATIPETLVKFAPIWKLVLFLTLSAFVIASFVEESGKWLISRRYRKINSDTENMEEHREVSCRGILAICSMGALGFATSENIGYVMGLSAAPSNGFPFLVVGMTLLRGVLAFPVHVGAQFYVGVAAAQKYIFHDENMLFLSLLVAILFHGSFDAAALIVGFFTRENMLPDWSMGIVVGFQCLLVTLLMLLCRGRYKGLLERERMVLMSQETV